MFRAVSGGHKGRRPTEAGEVGTKLCSKLRGGPEETLQWRVWRDPETDELGEGERGVGG